MGSVAVSQTSPLRRQGTQCITITLVLASCTRHRLALRHGGKRSCQPAGKPYSSAELPTRPREPNLPAARGPEIRYNEGEFIGQKGASMFESVEDVQQRFRDARYIASRRISTVVYLAARMGRPVLVEGPAGVGKTELAKTLSEVTRRRLIRLQCYEGLDEGKALYEWKYAKQLLYTQLLRERIGELIADAPSLPDAVAKIAGQEDAFFSFRFLSPRPLLSAILSEAPVVLLVDEIDKAEPEFEAFLLEVLSDFQVSVPELGTVTARHIPLVVLTSNNARELSDGLKRRCLHLFIDFPSPADELAIIRLKVPEIPEKLAGAVVAAVQKIRAMDLRKLPSVSESLDWARSLVILNAQELAPELVESTLTMLVKHEKDLERVKGALDKVLAE